MQTDKGEETMENVYDNHRVAILFSDAANQGLTHSFFSGIIDEFKVEMEKAGYMVGFLNTARNDAGIESYAQQMVSNDFEALFIASIDYEDESVKEVINAAYPVVTIDRGGEGTINVSSDNVGGMKNLVNYLADMGHSRIAYIYGDLNYVTNARLDTLLDTCASRGIKIPKEYLCQGKYRSLDKAAFHTEQLLMLPIPPTCIIYSDDYAAIGGKNVIRARGLHIPADISIVGYDGIDVIDKIEPVFTTVKQDTRLMGKTAASKLIDLMENPETASRENTVVATIFEAGHTVKRIY